MVLIKEKIPNNHFTYWAQYVKCTQNQFIILNVTLSWIWKNVFLGKTHLYWFSDYLLFLLTVYKYSINSWSVGQQLGNNFNKHKKGSVGWWKRRISGSQTQEHNQTKWSAPLHVHTVKNLEPRFVVWYVLY